MRKLEQQDRSAEGHFKLKANK